MNITNSNSLALTLPEKDAHVKTFRVKHARFPSPFSLSLLTFVCPQRNFRLPWMQCSCALDRISLKQSPLAGKCLKLWLHMHMKRFRSVE